MIGMDLKAVQGQFLDRKKVLRRVSKSKIKPLIKQGAYVRRTAKKSIAKPRMKTVGEMTPDERRSYERRVVANKLAGLPRPKRPLASSRPGDPPRSQTGTLKKFLFFSFDSRTESVVVGPARIRSDDPNAPSTLEFGGSATIRGQRRTIAPRPYMGPALAEEQPNFAALWRNSIR